MCDEQGSSVAVVTRLRDGRLGNRVSILGEGKCQVRPEFN